MVGCVLQHIEDKKLREDASIALDILYGVYVSFDPHAVYSADSQDAVRSRYGYSANLCRLGHCSLRSVAVMRQHMQGKGTGEECACECLCAQAFHNCFCETHGISSNNCTYVYPQAGYKATVSTPRSQACPSVRRASILCSQYSWNAGSYCTKECSEDEGCYEGACCSACLGCATNEISYD